MDKFGGVVLSLRCFILDNCCIALGQSRVGRILNSRICDGARILSFVHDSNGWRILFRGGVFRGVNSRFGVDGLIFLSLRGRIFDSGICHIFLLLLLACRRFWLLSCLDSWYIEFLQLNLLSKGFLLRGAICLVFLSNRRILCIVGGGLSKIFRDVLRNCLVVSYIFFNTNILIGCWCFGLNHGSRRDRLVDSGLLSYRLVLNLVISLQRGNDVRFHNSLIFCTIFFLLFFCCLILEVFWVFHDIVILHFIIMIPITDVVTFILIIIIMTSNLDSESYHYINNGKN